MWRGLRSPLRSIAVTLFPFSFFPFSLAERSEARNPTGPEKGGCRVLRGGAFVNYTGIVRAAWRGDLHPADRNLLSGFRLART